MCDCHTLKDPAHMCDECLEAAASAGERIGPAMGARPHDVFHPRPGPGAPRPRTPTPAEPACEPGCSAGVPEDAMGRRVPKDPMSCSDSFYVPGFVSSVRGFPRATQPDYTRVGTHAQLTAAVRGLYEDGRLDAATYPMASVAGPPQYFSSQLTALTATFARNRALGVKITWGITLNQFVPFNFEVRVGGYTAGSNWTGRYGQNLNRRITFAVSPDAGRVGSDIYIPFAYRETQSGSPIMGEAQIQPADYDVEGEAPTDRPSVVILGVPAGIVAGGYFNAQIQLMSAFAPATQEFLELCGWMDRISVPFNPRGRSSQ